jgi:hypothetical protein
VGVVRIGLLPHEAEKGGKEVMREEGGIKSTGDDLIDTPALGPRHAPDLRHNSPSNAYTHILPNS